MISGSLSDEVRQEWTVVMPDGKRYEVHHRYGHTGGKHKFAYWTVYGGGNNRRHHCDDEGSTYKRVMAAFRKHVQADADWGVA